MKSWLFLIQWLSFLICLNGATKHSWVLLDNSEEAVLDAIKRSAFYGVQEIQLSHDIIMDIDEILESEQKKQEITTYARLAHQ